VPLCFLGLIRPLFLLPTDCERVQTFCFFPPPPRILFFLVGYFDCPGYALANPAPFARKMYGIYVDGLCCVVLLLIIPRSMFLSCIPRPFRRICVCEVRIRPANSLYALIRGPLHPLKVLYFDGNFGRLSKIFDSSRCASHHISPLPN